MLKHLWKDNLASVMTAEVVMLTTLLAIGIIVGAKSFRDSAVTEWADWAQAISSLNQSYSISSNVTPNGEFIDTLDFCDTSDDDGPTFSSNAKFNGVDGDSPGDTGMFIRYGNPATGESP